MKFMKILCTVLLAVSLICTTSLAASNSKTIYPITGNATCSLTGASANTTNRDGGNAFVSVKVYYSAASGSFYWSAASENGGSSYVSTTKFVGAGNTAVKAESAHGNSKTNISFHLYPYAS